jgi:hypothetical protein
MLGKLVHGWSKLKGEDIPGSNTLAFCARTSMAIEKSGNTDRSGRLSTVNLLIKVTSFVKSIF